MISAPGPAVPKTATGQNVGPTPPKKIYSNGPGLMGAEINQYLLENNIMDLFS